MHKKTQNFVLEFLLKLIVVTKDRSLWIMVKWLFSFSSLLFAQWLFSFKSRGFIFLNLFFDCFFVVYNFPKKEPNSLDSFQKKQIQTKFPAMCFLLLLYFVNEFSCNWIWKESSFFWKLIVFYAHYLLLFYCFHFLITSNFLTVRLGQQNLLIRRVNFTHPFWGRIS